MMPDESSIDIDDNNDTSIWFDQDREAAVRM